MGGSVEWMEDSEGRGFQSVGIRPGVSGNHALLEDTEAYRLSGIWSPTLL